jgi:hypothetical protein
MTQNNNKRQQNFSESGITLLLAIFIMSGLSLIAITVSALAIQNIRNSRSAVFSEPAIGQAQSGAEEGLWNIKRNLAVPSCNNSPLQNSESVGAANTWSARTVCKDYTDATIDLSANTPYNFYLYDPDDKNGDVDLTGISGGDPYRCMTVDLLSGANNLKITVKRLDGTAWGSPSTTTINSSTAKGSSSCTGTATQATINNLAGPSGQDNRLQVTLTYCEAICVPGSSSAKVLVTTNIGMPTFPTIDSVGCAQRGASQTSACDGNEIYSRRINVSVPQ